MDPQPGNPGLVQCTRNTIAQHERMITNLEEALEGELTVEKQVFKDNNWGGTAIFNACSQLDVKPNDAIYFIYNGHGFGTNKLDEVDDKWPALWLQPNSDGTRDDLRLSDIYRKLASKQPRLLLVISESCNNYIDSKYTPPEVRGLYRKQLCKDLFVNSSGKYIVSGSKRGEVTWGPEIGCAFTHRFMHEIGETLGSNSYDEATNGWNAILTRSTQRMEVIFEDGATRVQNPQFESNPVLRD
jgi:hypothetical protein